MPKRALSQQDIIEDIAEIEMTPRGLYAAGAPLGACSEALRGCMGDHSAPSKGPRACSRVITRAAARARARRWHHCPGHLSLTDAAGTLNIPVHRCGGGIAGQSKQWQMRGGLLNGRTASSGRCVAGFSTVEQRADVVHTPGVIPVIAKAGGRSSGQRQKTKCLICVLQPDLALARREGAPPRGRAASSGCARAAAPAGAAPQ